MFSPLFPKSITVFTDILNKLDFFGSTGKGTRYSFSSEKNLILTIFCRAQNKHGDNEIELCKEIKGVTGKFKSDLSKLISDFESSNYSIVP